ncbi:hypothetical protein [Sphingomonas sp.]|uniref:hypothetical protein n=1 Tax=Sphingomonas sp. TaxID=28214 RepID=UPI0035BBF2F9
MTHTPPIPAGNQSPYPLHEPPHAKHDAPPPGDPHVARKPEPATVSVPTVIGIAAGIGLAAIAGGLFYAFGTSAKPKPRKKRKAAKQEA